MDPKQRIRASKKISLVLRHKPEAIGLVLDPQGWAKVSDLLRLMAANGNRISRTDLDFIVENNDKQRFRLSKDGQRIRANQGHSLDIDLQLKPVEPPAVLYHGTATHAVSAIFKTGLEKRSRQHVHLSHDRETAVRVGSRHGSPIVLTIDAEAMARDGHHFYCSDNGVWLTEAVPVQFLKTEWQPK